MCAQCFLALSDLVSARRHLARAVFLSRDADTRAAILLAMVRAGVWYGAALGRAA